MNDPIAETVAQERPRLTNLAYRLLGSLTDAEDAVQEAYARWFALISDQRDEIASPGAWLSTVTSRICLDVLGSARQRRERYVGEWVPEPVLPRGDWVGGRATGTGPPDPADQITLDESVSMAFLVVLEAMRAAERVAFVLHDVFRYPFAEVGEIVGRTPAACRQLASSARRRLRDSGAEPAALEDRDARAEQAAVVARFRRAWQTGDLDGLLQVLTEDAVTITDGGGKVRAQVGPVTGGTRVAEFLLARRPDGLAVLEAPVNGRAGLVVQRDGVTVMAVAFAVVGERIRHIWAVLNPDKLP